MVGFLLFHAAELAEGMEARPCNRQSMLRTDLPSLSVKSKERSGVGRREREREGGGGERVCWNGSAQLVYPKQREDKSE